MARAADADDAVAGLAEPLDDCRGVEVAIRDEEPVTGECASDVVGRAAPHREGQCRSARGARVRAVECDALDLTELVPESSEEGRAAAMQGVEGAPQRFAALRARGEWRAGRVSLPR